MHNIFYNGGEIMYKIVSKSGLVIEELSSLEKCKDYMQQALRKGSPAGYLSVYDEDGKEVFL